MFGTIIFKTFLILIFWQQKEVVGFSEKLSGESILYGLSSLTEKYSNEEYKECLGDLSVLYKGIEERHVWALKVMEASGEPRTGFLYGNNLWIGSHGHCIDLSNRKPLEINHDKVAHPPPTPFDYPPYPMKFVKIYMLHNNTLQLHTQLPFDFTIQVGLCVPKNCTNRDIFHLFRMYLTKNYLNIQQTYDLNLKLERVKTLEDDPSFILYLTKTKILLVIMIMVLLLSIVGTVYDVKRENRKEKLIMEFRESMMKTKGKTVSESELIKISQDSINQEESPTMKVLRCFSLCSNIKALVNTKLPPDSIRCIHGIRFFGMIWVCVIHSVFFQADYTMNVPYAYRLSENFMCQILSNSTYSVDTYLFLSGFLLAYLYYKSKKSNDDQVNYLKKLNEFGMMCFNRFIRLTPAYLIVILLCDVVYTYLRKTSSLESSEAPDLICPKYWWRNLLYINNLYPRTEMCLSWSWYMSVDTQAFVVSVILLIVSTFAFKAAAFVLVFIILGGMVATTYKSYSIGYIPTMDEQLIHLDDIYDLPWNRFGPYLVGVITGYLLVEKMQCKLVIGKVKKTILWIVFPLFNLWILFTLYTRQLSVEFSAVYMGISRTLWGVGLAWILTACCTGNAETINKFLSFPGWIPLSRLTFCAYLLNPLVANTLYLETETPFFSTRSGFAISIMGVVMATFYFAFLVSILFESPFILLTKILMKTLSKSPSNKEMSSISRKS